MAVKDEMYAVDCDARVLASDGVIRSDAERRWNVRYRVFIISSSKRTAKAILNATVAQYMTIANDESTAGRSQCPVANLIFCEMYSVPQVQK